MNKRGLSPIDLVTEQGYETLTPIQAQAIPAVLAGRDVMAAAQTGTGKTASFALPLLERLSTGPRVQANQARALILTPTRELAAQVRESLVIYGRHLPLTSAVVYGGVKINPQMMALRRGVDVLVATPGRLLDLYRQNAVRFTQLEVLVLDEADRMLDMGFLNDIRKILALLPQKRQTLMFSATFSDEIRKLANGLVHNPVEISISPRNPTVKAVEQWLCPVDKSRKPILLTHLIHDKQWQQVLVFTRTKQGANRLTHYLETKGIQATAIHGNKSQALRSKALADFKAGEVHVLVATDIAARGLDIEQLPQVVNFDLPHIAEDYVHRIGRTGRAGSSGQAVSLVSADEFKQLLEIEHLLGELLERRYIHGFEPVHDLPASRLDLRSKKPKKPKKPKAEHHDGQRTGESGQEHQPRGRKSSKKKPPKVGGRNRGGQQSEDTTRRSKNSLPATGEATGSRNRRSR